MKKIPLLRAAALIMQATTAQVLKPEAKAAAQADDFNTAYLNFCIKHLPNLNDLRKKLEDAPQLPVKRAEYFLRGQDGSAWAVPTPHNDTLILAIPAEKNICTLYARHADIVRVEAAFTTIGNTTPDGATGEKIRDEHTTDKTGHSSHTIAYQWQLPDTGRKMLISLTTTPDSDTQIMASAAILRDESKPQSSPAAPYTP